MHLSCDSCFKMWQQRVAVAELPDTPEHAAAPVAS
jgi:hypothetical protein